MPLDCNSAVIFCTAVVLPQPGWPVTSIQRIVGLVTAAVAVVVTDMLLLLRVAISGKVTDCLLGNAVSILYRSLSNVQLLSNKS